VSIERFGNGEFAIEMIPDSDGFKVIAAGLARALGHADGRDLIRNIPDDEKGSELVPTPGGDQRVWVLREPGFYRAIGQRQAARVKDPTIRAQVERFQSWVYGEVLPSLRRTGRYEVARREPTKLELARDLVTALEAREAAEARVKELEPSARAWDVLASAKGDFSLRDAATILNRDPNISTGPRLLKEKLLQFGMIDRWEVPYAKHRAHLVQRPRTYEHPYTGVEVQARPQLRITARGLRYLHRRLFEQPPLEAASGE
jgi:prophage antirepressor-like protein